MSVVEITDVRRRHGRTSPQAIARMDRERTAIALRTRGRNYDEIARECGYADRSGARKAVERGLQRHMRETVEEQRAILLHRTELAISRFMPLIDCENPDLRAVDRLAKVTDQQAKLLGLYSQPPQQPELPAGVAPTTALPSSVIALESVDEMTRTMIKNWAWSQYGIDFEFDLDAASRDGDDPDERDQTGTTPSHPNRDAAVLDDDQTQDDETDDDTLGEWRDGRFYPRDPLPDDISADDRCRRSSQSRTPTMVDELTRVRTTHRDRDQSRGCRQRFDLQRLRVIRKRLTRVADRAATRSRTQRRSG